MKATQEKRMATKEYTEHQLTCEGRHEYDNGHLYRGPDEMDIENLTASAFVYLFYQTLRKQGYHIYAHAARIAILNEPKFYYPDVFITREAETEYNEYVQYEPELIVEVTSDETYERNTVYKLHEYMKIPSLKYYLIIHFEKHFTLLHYRNTNNEWQMENYKDEDAVIDLQLLNVQLPMKTIYRGYNKN